MNELSDGEMETESIYVCKFCGKKSNQQNSVENHIVTKTDTLHGKTPDREDVNAGVKIDAYVIEHQRSSISLDDKYDIAKEVIKLQGSINEEIDNELGGEICNSLNVPKGFLVRVCEEQDIEYSFKGRVGPTRWDDLNEKQFNALRLHYFDGRKMPPEIPSGMYSGTKIARDTAEKYDWLLHPDFIDPRVKKDKIDIERGKREENGETVENDTDEILEAHKERENNTGTTETDNEIEKALKDHNSYKVEIDGGGTEAGEEENQEGVLLQEDEVFEVITALIKSGNEEKAEEIYERQTQQ